MKQRKKLPPAVQEFFRQHGISGGKKLKRQRGHAYYKKIGRLGGRPPKKK